jgi:hypothetical protein
MSSDACRETGDERDAGPMQLVQTGQLPGRKAGYFGWDVLRVAMPAGTSNSAA